MTLATERKIITLDEFMAMPESHDHELINGRLVEQSPMGAESSYIAGRLLAKVTFFLDEYPLGWIFGADTVFKCFKPPHTGRKPDVAFVRLGRLEDEKIPLGYVMIPPDLAVEVVSPNDLAYDVTSKVDQYLNEGVALVWTIYPNTRTVEIRRKNGTLAIVREDEDLTGEDIIPGFKVRVSSLFPARENVHVWPTKDD